MKRFRAFLLTAAFIVPTIAAAHPGNTDAKGCHTCKTNCSSWGLKTGEYHCHQNKGPKQPLVPVTSTKGKNGKPGVTKAAPKYGVTKKK